MISLFLTSIMLLAFDASQLTALHSSKKMYLQSSASLSVMNNVERANVADDF